MGDTLGITGELVGEEVGTRVKETDGFFVGVIVGEVVGWLVGVVIGEKVGLSVRLVVGDEVGGVVGLLVGGQGLVQKYLLLAKILASLSFHTSWGRTNLKRIRRNNDESVVTYSTTFSFPKKSFGSLFPHGD